MTEVEDGGDGGGLGGGEADAVGVVGEGEEEDDVGQHAEPAVGEEEEVFGAFEEGHVEGELRRADLLVAVFHQQGADGVDGEGDDAEHAEGPGEPDGADHGAGREGVGQPAEAGAGGRDAVRETPACREPLGYDADGAHEEEAHAEAEAEALGEEEMPDFGGEGGRD